MNTTSLQRGFSLIELLVAATVFTFVMTGVSQLFSQALDIQRRATGYQKIQENAQFVMESIAREVRVSSVQSPTGCNPELTIEHPVNGTVTYAYNNSTNPAVITRVSGADGGDAAPITSSDVTVAKALFCVFGAGADGRQARVTIPLTLEAVSSKASGRVSISLQTTISSRDLIEELSN